MLVTFVNNCLAEGFDLVDFKYSHVVLFSLWRKGSSKIFIVIVKLLHDSKLLNLDLTMTCVITGFYLLVWANCGQWDCLSLRWDCRVLNLFKLDIIVQDFNWWLWPKPWFHWYDCSLMFSQVFWKTTCASCHLLSSPGLCARWSEKPWPYNPCIWPLTPSRPEAQLSFCPVCHLQRR